MSKPRTIGCVPLRAPNEAALVVQAVHQHIQLAANQGSGKALAHTLLQGHELVAPLLPHVGLNLLRQRRRRRAVLQEGARKALSKTACLKGW